MLISRRLEGEFLNYRNTIPKTNKYEILAEKRNIITAVDRVSLIISDRVKSPVRFTFSLNKLKVRTSTPLGKANDECDVIGDGEELEIGFNNRYLSEALRFAPAQSVKMELNTGISPCVIVPTEGEENFIYMVLPILLRERQ